MKVVKLHLLWVALWLVSGVAHAWEAGRLRIWVNADKGYAGIQRVAQAYTRQTGVPVVVEHFDHAVDRFEAAMTAGRSEDMPDIWIWPHDRLGDWVAKGWIEALQPDESVRQDVVQVGWDAFTAAGRVWGYPIAVEAVALVYNRRWVSEPPKTFEEVPALHEKLRPHGVRALGWETASPYFTWPLMAAGGAYVFQRQLDGTYNPQDTGLTHPGAVQGLEYLRRLIDAGVIPAGGLGYAAAQDDMLRGKQALWITGPWAWEALQAAGVDFGVAPLPTLGGKPARPFVGVLGAMIVKGTPNRAAAVAFLERHLLQPAGLEAVNAAKPIGVPASKRMFWKLYADARIRTSMEAIYAGRPMPSNREMSHFWQHLAAALREVNQGARRPREALEAAAAALRAGVTGRQPGVTR